MPFQILAPVCNEIKIHHARPSYTTIADQYMSTRVLHGFIEDRHAPERGRLLTFQCFEEGLAEVVEGTAGLGVGAIKLVPVLSGEDFISNHELNGIRWASQKKQHVSYLLPTEKFQDAKKL